jgi:hypothetical protein
MEKYKIEKLEGIIAYVVGFKIEQINTADFIIFRVEEGVAIEEVKRIIDNLKLKGVDKTFLILPKTIEYCVFKKGDK